MCVVTHARKCENSELCGEKTHTQKDSQSEICTNVSMPDLSALSFPASAVELGKEQHSDSSLDELFQSVVSPVEVDNVARGYLVHDGVLLWKYIPHNNDFVGDPVFQIVVPVKYRRMMIEIAHDQLGHQGVRKTYDRLLQYFFWPHLK